jgi:hypothetical protein
MVQPDPSAGQMPEPVHPGPPPSVVMAVRLMYTGAVVSALSLIVGLATVGSFRASIRTSLHKANPKVTPAQVHNIETIFVVGSVGFQVISIGLWVWMALMNKAGKSWARIVAIVLFGLNTLSLLLGVARTGAASGILVSVLIWLIGLGAVIYLWRRDASEYFTARSTSPAR